MFKKATRKQAKLKLALSGVSGSGKTYSSLRIATGIGGKIAVIDTENGSASLYANDFNFDVCEISPPYTVDAYVKAIEEAEKYYDIIIVDSISHQWKGEGGILNKKEQLDGRGGNSFTNWAKLTPEQERFVSAILHSPKHIICTMRSKQEYSMTSDSNGKTRVTKVGLAPIQREGLEYEFTAVFDIASNNEAEASKDRTKLFKNRIFQITEDTGRELKAWLESGETYEPPKRQETRTQATQSTQDPRSNGERKVTEAQIKRLFAIQKSTNWSEQDVKNEMMARFGINSTKELTMSQYDELVSAIQTANPPDIDPNEQFPA